MVCACLKNDFNVSLTDAGCSSIVLEDQSIWMKGDLFDPSEFLIITLMPLSSGVKKDLKLYVNKRNVYEVSEIIGNNVKCLNDDIYCITTTSCGVTYSINRAYLCSTRCKIDTLIAKAKTTEDWEDINYLQNLVSAVDVNSRLGKVTTASESLKILVKKLKNITCGTCS